MARLDSTPIFKLATRDITDTKANFPIASFCNEVGTWDIDFLLQSLPYQVLLRVVAMQIDTLSKDDDVAYWRLTSNGLFLVRATYEVLT